MPGPDIIYVLVQSITNGKKYGIVTALGLVSGIIVHTTLVAFGVSAVLKQSEILFFIIKLFGALYLLYLAYLSYKATDEVLLDSNVQKKGLLKLFKQGFVMNVLNPKVSIFFLAFFPGFLFSESISTVTQFYILGGLFMLQALFVFSMVSILSGSFAQYLQRYPTYNSNIKWFKIIVFLGIAFFILFS
ncbi:Threonine/homoserine/homoserine lactone efflux protein [Lutibacter agarilyticus]|uniref:Threonine/homoserine/homoserine lactone efflux protein n=2 Tax=Lutibacter agarilyticus TaxID=1109740 RepID=A0A238VFR1_9FLAO|nr:Threonine/homoserine/homoserine lactone efflux protein [Lutibacter agarilyticus]